MIGGRGALRFTGAAGVDLTLLSSTLPEFVAMRRPLIMASPSEVTIKVIAAQVVAFESTVAEPRGPKTVENPCRRKPLPNRPPDRFATEPR